MSESIESSAVEKIEWREFLTDRPPGSRMLVDRAAYPDSHIHGTVHIQHPDLKLYCDGACQKTRHCKYEGGSTNVGKLFGGVEKTQFRRQSGAYRAENNLPFDAVLIYACEKCFRIVKSYSLRFWTLH